MAIIVNMNDALRLKQNYESHIVNAGARGVAVKGNTLVIMVASEEDISRVRSQIAGMVGSVPVEYKVVGFPGAL